MPTVTRLFAFTSLLLSGAIFGFFYAWICSTMWGLDGLDPRIAIAAMQAMNGSVRNIVFAPAFFATPFVLILTAGLVWRKPLRRSAVLFGAAGLTYLIGGMILTIAVNVPMNQALGQVTIPDDLTMAQQIWDDYSPKWQRYNVLRTVFSGIALMLTGGGIYLLGVGSDQSKRRSAGFPDQNHGA